MSAMTPDARRKFSERQFQLSLVRAQRFHAEVVSGAYKLRRTQCGVDGGGWRDLTDEEKLADALATMDRHLEFAQKVHDGMEDNGNAD